MTPKQRAEIEATRAKIAASVKDGIAERIRARLSIIEQVIPVEKQDYIKALHDERLRLLHQLEQL